MSLIAEALYRLEERAGLIEFDGGVPRAEAERLAIEQFENDEEFGQGVKREAVRMFREKIEESGRR